MKRKIKGFTLVELVITITIIIVLSAVSVPIYKNYTGDAILAEGYILLSAIREAQKNYYAEYGCFLYYTESSAGTACWTNNEEVLGIDARGNKYFTWFEVGYTGPKTNTGFRFHARAMKPAEIRSYNDDSLCIQYNLSLGQRFCDYPKGVVDW